MTLSLRSTLLCAVACTLAIACSDSATGPRPGSGGTPAHASWTAAAAGTYNSCAVSTSGGTYCWGFGLIAPYHPTLLIDSVPKLVPGGVAFVSVASGGGFHCGVTATAEAYCWGSGSLGDGTTTESATPVRVAIASPISAVTTGFQHACALTTAGVAYCWGGAGSALGLGPGIQQSAMPKPVATSLTFTAISAGNTQTCAIASDAAAYCWGSGYGSLGAGARDTSCTYKISCLESYTPIPVDSDLRWASISAGNTFTCAVTLDHRGYCWGAVQMQGDPNLPLGVLGSGQFAGSKSPVPVTGGLSFRSIATGTRQACGVTLDGAAFCWGDNTAGELGTGSIGGRAAAPQRVAGNINFSSLTLADPSCGLAVDGALYCWGTNYGAALGIGRTEPGVEAVPTFVAPPAE